MRLLQGGLGDGRVGIRFLRGAFLRRLFLLGRRGFLARVKRRLVRLLRGVELRGSDLHLLLRRRELCGGFRQRAAPPASEVQPERLFVHLAFGLEQLVFPSRVQRPRAFVRVLRRRVRFFGRDDAELDIFPRIVGFILGVRGGFRRGGGALGLALGLGLGLGRWGDGGLGRLGHLRECELPEAVEPAVHDGPWDRVRVDQRRLHRVGVDAGLGAGVEDHRECAPFQVELGERLLGLRVGREKEGQSGRDGRDPNSALGVGQSNGRGGARVRGVRGRSTRAHLRRHIFSLLFRHCCRRRDTRCATCTSASAALRRWLGATSTWGKTSEIAAFHPDENKCPTVNPKLV